MTTKQRIEKLEKAKQNDSALNHYKYLCVIDESADKVFSQAEGFTVQCCAKEKGGTHGEPIHFDARADLDDFAARPDVDLSLIRLVNDRH